MLKEEKQKLICELVLIPIAYYMICMLFTYIYGKYMRDQINIITVIWLALTTVIPTVIYGYYNAGLFAYNVLLRKGNRIIHVFESLMYSLAPVLFTFLSILYFLNM